MDTDNQEKGSPCAGCHYTFLPASDDPVAGVSCENCHGAAKNWVDDHAKFGGPKVTVKTEDLGHRSERLKRIAAAGMIRPARTHQTGSARLPQNRGAGTFEGLYTIAENCFQCHTVPNQELVNTGLHPAGSAFDLVSWSQGEMRHNVSLTRKNDPASKLGSRMMYVVGKALDLEYALRGLAKATKAAAMINVEFDGKTESNPNYTKAMTDRAKGALAALKKIAMMIPADEVKSMSSIIRESDLKPNNSAPLMNAAGRLAKLTKGFARKYNGETFGGVDGLIPNQVKGDVFQ